MNNESKAILAKCTFDEGRLMKETEVIKDGIRWQTTFGYKFISGCNKENARLLPIITALLKDRERLREALKYIGQNTPIEEMKRWQNESLLSVIVVDADCATEALDSSDALVKEILK